MESPTTSAPTAGSSDELARVRAEIGSEFGGEKAPTGAAAPGPEGSTEDRIMQAVASPDAIVLDEGEIAGFWEMAFGLVAESRGPHWEIEKKRALRLARFTKMVIEKRLKDTKFMAWIMENLDVLLFGFFLCAELWRALKIDRQLRRVKGVNDVKA